MRKLMRCHIQLIITLLVLTLSSCRSSSSSISRMEKLSWLKSTYSVESLDLIITPISLPSMECCPDTSRQKKPFLPYSFHVQGVRTTHTADNVLLIDSVNQQQEPAHGAQHITDSANKIVLASFSIVMIIFLGYCLYLLGKRLQDNA